MDNTTPVPHSTFLLYRSNGEIVGHLIGDPDSARVTAEREALGHLQVDAPVHGDTHHVFAAQATPRPANSAVLDGLMLKNLPVPCTITVDGTRHGCNEHTAELSFSHPGTYLVKVSAWPMLDATFQVTQS